MTTCRRARIALAAALAGLGAGCAASPQPDPAATLRLAAVRGGLDWLVRHQEPAGGWRASGFPKRCAGPPCEGAAVFSVDDAVSALAALALSRAGREGEVPGAEAARRLAIDRLSRAQEPDGRIGFPDLHAARFNHILPTLALLEEARRDGAPAAVGDAARKALAAAARQIRAGPIDDCEAPWYAMALRAGERLGERSSGPLHGRLLHWLQWARDNSQNVTRSVNAGWVICRRAAGEPAGAPEVRALADGFADGFPSAEGADFYLAYLGLLALREAKDPRAESWARAAEDLLLHLQRPSAAGCAAGSWDPDPLWGSAGGRIYATAFAVLILEAVADLPRRPGPLSEKP